MPLNFPNSPSLNDEYTFGNKTWIWNGAAWKLKSDGAINDIPIGNSSPSTGAFTTLSASGTFTGTTVEAAQIGNSGATLTGTLDTAAQTNITSVGTLTGLTLSGTLTGTTVNAALIGNNGATLVGDGTAISSITGANVSGTVANATYALEAGNSNTANSATTAGTANQVIDSTQSNITAVGTLTGLTLSGTLTGTAINAATIGNSGAEITGTLQTAAQTNITSVGTLTGLTLSGTLTGTSLEAATIGNAGAAFIGDGTALTSLTGANITGTVANATYAIEASNSNTSNSAITAGTANQVIDATQSNITAVGTLTGLTLSGTLTGTTINAATIGNSGAAITGTLQTAAQTNITSLGTLTGLTLSGTLTGTTVEAAQIGNSGATLTGTLDTAAQTNITGLGTLTGLTLSGNVSGTNYIASGNVNASSYIIEGDGVFWSNGDPYSSGGGGFTFANVYSGTDFYYIESSNTSGRLGFVAGTGVALVANVTTGNIAFSIDQGASTADADYGLVTEEVTLSSDYGLVTDGVDLSADYGTIAVDGIVVTSSIVDGVITPVKLSTGHPDWDSNGNVTLGTDVVYVDNQNYRVGINNVAPTADLDVTGNIAGNLTGTVYSTGNIIPSANATYDLGTSSLRWNNVYTSDLSLANEHGSWTIVEGEDDLFLYNNKRGKVYKFALIEVNPEDAPPKRGT